jgi:hypothetical protein
MLLTKFSTVIADGPCFGFIEVRVTRFAIRERKREPKYRPGHQTGGLLYCLNERPSQNCKTNKVQLIIETIAGVIVLMCRYCN